MKADLHLHSIYSDGESTPVSLAATATAKGLELVSLTDHDTTDGIAEMKEALKGTKTEFINGIELSTFSCAEIHILGYNFKFNSFFNQKLSEIKEKRADRVKKIIKRLRLLNIDITEEEVFDFAGSSTQAGRVHIAKILTAKNITKSVPDAFDRLLGFGKSAYVKSDRLSPRQAIDIILGAEGKPVLAHPFLININKQHLIPLIKELASYGLCGIEAQYYAHTNFETDFLTELARKLKLIATCGSDYHGTSRLSEVFGFELNEKDYIGLKL